jgi:hypothetical protein
MIAATALPDAYFNWLYDQLFKHRDVISRLSYTTMCHCMHQIEFRCIVPFDDNRIAYASTFRNQYLEDSGLSGLELTNLMLPNATMLEVLYGLARQADDMIPIMVPTWFEIFFTNLGLVKYNDEYCLKHNTYPMVRRLVRFNNRDYRSDGLGGIFPLRKSDGDQREVELWRQMGAWMTENGMY